MSTEVQQEVAALRARRDALLAEVLKHVPERERGDGSVAALSARRIFLYRVPRDLFDRVLRAERELNEAARRAVSADPCVRAALDVFGAEVAEVRVRVGEGGA